MKHTGQPTRTARVSKIFVHDGIQLIRGRFRDPLSDGIITILIGGLAVPLSAQIQARRIAETKKIMEDDRIQVNPTAVRVPVFYGHSEAVHIETLKKITADEARALLEKAPGVIVMDERKPGGYPTAIEAAGNDATYVGRIREDISHPMGLDLWVVSDNVRKGAALNSVQIAEILIAEYLN